MWCYPEQRPPCAPTPDPGWCRVLRIRASACLGSNGCVGSESPTEPHFAFSRTARVRAKQSSTHCTPAKFGFFGVTSRATPKPVGPPTFPVLTGIPPASPVRLNPLNPRIQTNQRNRNPNMPYPEMMVAPMRQGTGPRRLSGTSRRGTGRPGHGRPGRNSARRGQLDLRLRGRDLPASRDDGAAGRPSARPQGHGLRRTGPRRHRRRAHPPRGLSAPRHRRSR